MTLKGLQLQAWCSNVYSAAKLYILTVCLLSFEANLKLLYLQFLGLLHWLYFSRPRSCCLDQDDDRN